MQGEVIDLLSIGSVATQSIVGIENWWARGGPVKGMAQVGWRAMQMVYGLCCLCNDGMGIALQVSVYNVYNIDNDRSRPNLHFNSNRMILNRIVTEL